MAWVAGRVRVIRELSRGHRDPHGARRPAPGAQPQRRGAFEQACMPLVGGNEPIYYQPFPPDLTTAQEQGEYHV